MTETRGTRGRAFTLLTPENHYASRLPNLPGALVYKLVTPRLIPARFGQYLVAFPGPGLRAEVLAGYENFFFGLEGAVALEAEGGGTVNLAPRSYAYLPASANFVLRSEAPARVLWIKRLYEAWGELASPEMYSGSAEEVLATETATPGLRRTELIAVDDPSFDFNMSLMAFDPEVSLPQIEIHDEEHGLYMTDGRGVYVLDGAEHEVREGDFIYMAPYCPQGFGAGAEGAEYLLYKDVYRDGF